MNNISILSLKKNKQKIFHDQAYKVKTGKVHTLIGDFVEYFPLKVAVSLIPRKLSGISVADICCGDGFEARYLRTLKADITALDISMEAIKKIKKKYPSIKGEVGDAENLPFSDKSFDYAFIVAGLHHLPHPKKGIRELYRVTKKGFVFIEAQRNILTAILIKLGMAEEIEESGNVVYRFSRSEVNNMMRRLGIKKYYLRTFWCRYVNILNERVYKYFNKRIYLNIFKLFFHTFNLLFGYWGNCLIVVAIKNDKSDV